MKIAFRDIHLSPKNKLRLGQINAIIQEYQRQGLRLTLRQLYYQLVSRDVIPNDQKEYSKLSTVLKEGRMAGIVDWNAIEDRLRVADKPSGWNSPEDVLDAVVNQYMKPRMDGQQNYLEVWVEKDALSGVLRVVTEKYHVPILVNRGYSSVSAIYDAYKRFAAALEDGQQIIILYLGDYDPSGIDMIRDVKDRPLEMLLSKSDDIVGDIYQSMWEDNEDFFDDLRDKYEQDPQCYIPDQDDDERKVFDATKAMIKERFNVIPLALTRDQIRQYNPPPNPAKKEDPRAKDFIKKHGNQSWEVDALRPEVLNTLLDTAIRTRIDIAVYDSILEQEEKDKKKLEKLKDNLSD